MRKHILNELQKSITLGENNTPPVIGYGGNYYALLPVALEVYDEVSKTVYHVNSFYDNTAPEMGTLLDTITLEKADRTA